MLAQQFLEASAARRPDSIALICGEERLSYTELDLAANRFARGAVNRREPRQRKSQKLAR